MTIEVGGSSGGGLPQLAPDLTAPTRWHGASYREVVTGLNSGGAPITVLSIPNSAGYITKAYFDNLTAGTQTIKLTIDGVIIFNDVWTTVNSIPTLIGGAASTVNQYDPVSWKNSFLLEITSADTSFEFYYFYRKTL